MKNNKFIKPILCTMILSVMLTSMTACNAGKNGGNISQDSEDISSSAVSSGNDSKEESSKNKLSKSADNSVKSQEKVSKNSENTSEDSSKSNSESSSEKSHEKSTELESSVYETESTVQEYSEEQTQPLQESQPLPVQASEIQSSTISVTEESISESSEELITAACPAEWRDNGIFYSYYTKAYAKVTQMNIEEKIGQMLLARCPVSEAESIAAKYHLGGYVLFGANTDDKTKSQLYEEITAAKNSQNIPMIISVDEEGGTVVRISSNSNIRSSKFRSPRSLYAEGGLSAINSDAKEKADLLSSLNIDVNLAPVCDLSTDPDDFMYDRSLGESPEVTAEYIRNVTKISQENGVSVCLKHFPGYGNNVDTHTGIAIDKRSMESFRENDFVPFKAGIDSGAHMVLVSHNIVECMDSTKPASISPKVHEILRNELGFTGIIVTDDMVMDAINYYSGEYTPVVSAVLAGNDMIIVSDIDTAYNDILSAVKKGDIDEKMIDHAVMRVLAWKDCIS